jgi:hypothetical protein
MFQGKRPLSIFARLGEREGTESLRAIQLNGIFYRNLLAHADELKLMHDELGEVALCQVMHSGGLRCTTAGCKMAAASKGRLLCGSAHGGGLHCTTNG